MATYPVQADKKNTLPILDALKERVLIFDGAMGTSLQNRVELKDYQGYEGNTEILSLTRPELVYQVHRAFIDAGCDAIETNTFGANLVVQGEYGLAHRVYELNAKAVEIARQAAVEGGSQSHPIYIIGSIGPGTKLPTLGQISPDELYAAYHPQFQALIDSQVNALLIETCQDLLQAKTAVLCAQDVLREKKDSIPIFLQITIETTGTMLLGTEPQAALAALEPLGIALFGLNCATGPEKMVEPLRTLSTHFPRFLSVLPNAGIPEIQKGAPKYPLTPQELAAYHRQFVHDFGVNIVGGCCGTTPEHLRAVSQTLWGTPRKKRQVQNLHGASSSFQFVSFTQDPPPLLIGERTNANGSRKFKELLSQGDLEGMLQMAKEQEQEGAHMLDLCLAYVGRKESQDMQQLVPHLARQVTLPIVIDSTEADAIEKALQHFGGRCVINSINLEDGGERLHRVTALAKRYGAALIALTIDEKGMAKTRERKLEVAQKIFDIVHRDYGVEPSELLFDPLTFTLGSGDEEFRQAGIETLEGIRAISQAIPGCFTVLGISNISFGLKPPARKVLNSVFLHEAVRAGLKAAIVHARQILPIAQIEKKHREIALDLIYDRRRPNYDPLHALLAAFEKTEDKSPTPSWEVLPVPERLQRRIVEGKMPGLQQDLEEALRDYSPLQIINEFLIRGMQEVGDLFGRGELQLPFVLQSAEVMKKAVAILEPFMEKKDATKKGRIVLATVRGDVHDIGKNLVDIILTNNGYEVFNLGIKCPLETMLEKAEEVQAHAVGMSGLLVKSVAVMRENLEELNRRGKLWPVILGGAALNRRYVEKELQPLYQGSVSFAQDAFEGMAILEALVSGKRQISQGTSPRKKVEKPLSLTQPQAKENLAPQVAQIPAAPHPYIPFFGKRVLSPPPLSAIYPFVNKLALFRGGWQFKQGKKKWSEYQTFLQEEVEPIFQRLKREAQEKSILSPQASIGFFYCTKERDELILLGEDKSSELARFRFPRQKKPPYLCLTDFIAERTASLDTVALSAVTVGSRASAYCQELFAKDQYREYLFWHGFSVECAEALAEWTHREIRRLWKIAESESQDSQRILKMEYQGCRYSLGYPACPNLEDQEKIFALLHPEEIGISLTESFQLVPEQSTTAIVFHHPKARYFNAE